MKESSGSSKKFIENLIALKDSNDRKRLAELRRGLSKTTYCSSWAALAAIGGCIESIVDLTVAGFFALHPEMGIERNMGALWRQLRYEVHGQLPGRAVSLTSFELRFNRLLSCKTTNEICQYLRPIIVRAKSKGLGVNYWELHSDLENWGDKIRKNWAREYWKVDESQTTMDENEE